MGPDEIRLTGAGVQRQHGLADPVLGLVGQPRQDGEAGIQRQGLASGRDELDDANGLVVLAPVGDLGADVQTRFGVPVEVCGGHTEIDSTLCFRSSRAVWSNLASARRLTNAGSGIRRSIAT